MACDIKFSSASATSLAQQGTASTITIGGSAEDCAQVNVTISCPDGSASKVADVGFNGSWSAIFDASALGCACGQSFGVSASCVGNPECFKETSFVLECDACPDITGIGFIVHLSPPTPVCVNGKTRVPVTVFATGTPGAGTYNWDFDDNSSAVTYVPSVDHVFEFPGLTYNVELKFEPAEPGCPLLEKVKALVVPDCSDLTPTPPPKDRPKGIIDVTDVRPKPTDPVPHPDPLVPPGQAPTIIEGGGRLACDALLVGAISLFLAGGLTVAIAICAKALLVGAIGGAIAALGIILFFLWWAICGKITSCDVMQKMHRMLRLTILFGVPLALLGGGLQALGAPINLDAMCWGGILGYLGSIAWIKDRLEDFMEEAGCPVR